MFLHAEYVHWVVCVNIHVGAVFVCMLSVCPGVFVNACLVCDRVRAYLLCVNVRVSV